MKDLVEHIRTVHFSVLVVILAMTAALRIEPKRAALRAASDADAIWRMSQRWDQTSAAISKAADANIIVEHTKDMVWPQSVHSERDFGTLYSVSYPKSDGKRLYFAFREKWGYLDGFAPDGTPEANYVKQWNSLNDFFKFWDGLHDGTAAIVPIAVSVGPPDKFCSDLRIEPVSPSGKLLSIRPGSRSAPKRIVANGLRYSYAHEGDFESWLIKPLVIGYGNGPLNREPQCNFLPQPMRRLHFDLARALQTVSTQASLWGTGSSTEEFPELRSSAKYLEQVPLSVLADVLRERANAEPEQVELFQAKFPASTIPLFGGLILLFCEGYLFAHLVELSQIAKSTPPNEWPSGYIGLYTSTITFFFTVFTFTGFPLVPLIWNAVKIAGIARAVSITFAAGSLFLGLLCSQVLWRVRMIRKNSAPLEEQAPPLP